MTERVRSVLALGLGLLLLVGCTTSDAGPLASLKAMPEAQLLYPGAATLDTYVINQEVGGIDGPVPAEFGHLQGTNASQADVVTFYLHALTVGGWVPANVVGRGDTETAVIGWRKGDVQFRLAFQRRGNDPRLAAPSDQARFATIFRTDLTNLPAASSSP